MRRLMVLVVALLMVAGNACAQDSTDVLGRILSEVDFTRTDLGYRPAGYWNRFPLDIPYRLTSFDALFAEPLKLPDYATVMANTVDLYLDPAFADSADDGLYKLVYNLGVDKRLGGFRSYSANLLDAPTAPDPILEAIHRLYRQAGQGSEFIAFGQKAEWPADLARLVDTLKQLPDTVRVILAQLIVNLGEAVRWRELAFRNCDRDDMERVFRIHDLADTQADGTVYHAELDDLAATIDLPSLHYAALKTVAAAEKAERALLPLVDQVPRDLEVDVATPYGRVVLLSPPDMEKHRPSVGDFSHTLRQPGKLAIDADNTLLFVDFGGNTVYEGAVGATASTANPISVVIDLDGDDIYGLGDSNCPPNAGVGLLGVGLVLDSRGNDSYNGTTFSQGAGLFGVGVLLDREGNDRYTAELSAQGAGYFGIGLCFDQQGDDEYYLWGDGQGMGGVGGGVGVCASFEGDDKYTAEPLAEVIDRGDYHSEHKINGNNAQGAGFGRRGDGSDGHSWAGGLGAIIDIHGDDYYRSGNWTLGVGYWFATGIAIDRSGDDIYESCYFTQGSGAHYCNGILIDEAGNDRHELYETAGAALGFGWDYTNALLINKGGDDIYRAKMISNAFLIDIGGDDEYFLGRGTPGLGEATWREDYDHPSRLTPYYSYAKSFGGFIDIGGEDAYYEFDDTSHTAHGIAANDSLWLQPPRADSTFGSDNYGVGIDVESGTIPELFKW